MNKFSDRNYFVKIIHCYMQSLYDDTGFVFIDETVLFHLYNLLSYYYNIDDNKDV